MEQEEIKSRINDLIHREFEIPLEKLTPESKLFEELGLDSLDAVDMLVNLEDSLGIKVAGEEFSKIRILRDVYDLVAEAQVIASQS